MKKIILIGLGSISKNHIFVLKKIKFSTKILKISSRKFDMYNQKKMNQLKIFDPDMIILCSPTSKHFSQLKRIEKTFVNKRVLIEKPVFEKYRKIPKKLKNKYFVGYNLRFHPVLKFLKKYLNGKKCYFVRVNCSSFLPDWRKQNYTKTVSSQKKLGGGVLLELSHEIDYLLWIFKKIKIINAFNKKISNLKIDTDDILILNGITLKKTIINLTMNFFSKIEKREIFIDGQNFSIHANILDNSVMIREQNKRRIIRFKKFSMSKTYKLENSNILNRNMNGLCTLKEGNELLNFISKIKKK